jgi:putative peptidoglycan lipid II flippase
LSEEVKEPRADRGRGLVRAAGLVSGLTMVSRLLGLGREMLFAALLGAGVHADAFQIAYRIPNLLRDLFAEGALSAAFIPTWSAALNRAGRERANQLASSAITLLALVMAALVGIGMLGARPLAELLAPGFEAVPGKLELTTLLTRVMLPFLPLVSLSAVAMGMLNAEERFGAPAFAPATFNIVAIVWAAGLWWGGYPATTVAVGWAVGVVVGGLAQLAIQVPALWRRGFRLRPRWAPRDPGIRHMLMLMGPATLGLAAVQINIFINSRFASWETGAVSWLQFGFRVLYLPIGVFGVALGTIATAGLARRAALGDLEGLRRTLREALRLLAFLTIPASVGLLVLREPIIRLIFERGAFTPADTVATAAALGFYSLGLVGYTGVKVLAPAFYALGQPRIPLLGSAAAVAANLLLVSSLHARFGFRAVALATAVASVVNGLVLLGAFEKRIGGLSGHGLLRAALTMSLAALPMAAVAWFAQQALDPLSRGGGLLGVAAALAPIAAGALVYALAARLLRIEEMATILQALRRRRGVA